MKVDLSPILTWTPLVKIFAWGWILSGCLMPLTNEGIKACKLPSDQMLHLLEHQWRCGEHEEKSVYLDL